MAKHPSSSRANREDPGPDDAFVAGVKKLYAWSEANSRYLTIGLGAILVAVAGFVWFTTQQRQLESQAATRLTQVQQTVASGNAELAVRDLRQYLDRFGGTRTSDQARLVLANILLGQGDAQAAVDALGAIPTDLDAPFGLAGARLRAAALEDLGQADDAVATYLRIADNARFDYQRREALDDAARLQLQNGHPEQAAGLYQRIIDTFDDDAAVQRNYYEMWLAEARAQARHGVAMPAATPADDAPAATDSTTG